MADSAHIEQRTTPAGADRLRVFISYSRDDLAVADAIDAALRIGNFETTLDRHGVHGGEAWKEKLHELIRNADTVVFVLSPASARSDICKWEVDEAVALGKRIIPAVAVPLEGVDAPGPLAALNYIYLYAEEKKPGSGFGPGLIDLVEALKADRGWLREHTQLLLLATLWHNGGRSDNRLLSGAAIRAAKDWAARRPQDAPPLTELHLDFIYASEQAEARQQNEERHQKELAAEQAKRAEAQRQEAEALRREAAADKLVKRRTQIGLGVAMALALLAGGFGLVAWLQKIDADEHRMIAELLKERERIAKEEAVTQANAAKTAQQRAEGSEKLEIAARHEAVNSRNETLSQQSRYYTDLARDILEKDKDAGTALLLALDVMRDSASDKAANRERPLEPKAESMLEQARRALREIRLISGHGEPVKSVAISADGAVVVTGSADGSVRVTDGRTGAVSKTLLHESAVVGLAITPDGSRVVTGSEDNKARLWETQTGRLLNTFEGHDNTVSSVAITPDGKRIATGSNDLTARVWDAATGAVLAELKGHEDWITSIAMTSDGSRVLTGSDDKSARVWDVAKQATLAILAGHTEAVFSVAMTANGSRAVTGSADRTARIWDVTVSDGSTLPATTTLAGHDGAIYGVAITADGTRVATASQDMRIKLWDARYGLALATLGGHDDWIMSLAMTPDGAHIVTGSDDKTARLWDGRTSVPVTSMLGHASSIAAVAITPDGKRIVTGADDRSARLWNGQSGEQIHSFDGRADGKDESFAAVAISADGSKIATGDSLRILTGKEKERTARLWDAASHIELRKLVGHRDAITSVAVTAAGDKIVTGSRDRTARVWDASTGNVQWSLTLHKSTINGVAITPDGARIVTGSADRTARIWNGQTGQAEAELKDHKDVVSSVAITPDGAWVVTGSSDKTARLWDGKSGELKATFTGHSGSVTSVAITADAEHVVTGSQDRTARLWSARTGTAVATFAGHEGSVRGVAITADGKRIVTAAADKSVRVWDSSTGARHLALDAQGLVDHVKTRTPRCLTAAQRDRWHLAATPNWCITTLKWPNDPASQASDLATSAENLFQANNWRDAIATFEKAIALDPSIAPRLARPRSEAHNMAAWSAFEDVLLRGKPSSALAPALVDADKAIALAPESENVLDTRGQIYLALGRYDEAFADLDKVIAKGNDFEISYYSRGRIHEHRGNREAAIADYKRALELAASGAGYVAHVREKSRERLEALGVAVPQKDAAAKE
jgi:WD40 repeat protein